MNKLSLEMMILAAACSLILSYMLAAFSWRRAVHLAFIMALLEGGIRKWLLPGASELVYFGKDIILFGAYIKFYFNPDFDLKGYYLKTPAMLVSSACLMLIMVGALNPNIGSMVLAVYGVKIYLWYVPLAFMMPYLFRSEQELTRVLFWYCMISVPICLLGAAQFFAGPTSPLNCYVQTAMMDSSQVATFGAGSERARITGTFSFITGHTTFVILFFGLTMALLTGITDKRKWILLLVNLPLLAANALMSGSRGAVYTLVLFTLIFVAMTTITRVGKTEKGGGGALGYLLAGIAAVALVANIFFKDALNEFEGRRRTANDTTASRLYTPLWSIQQAAKDVGLAGFGIGMSHPAVEAMRNRLKLPRAKEKCPVYDSEMGQVLAELGWAGFLMWYALRFWIVWSTWIAYKRAAPSVLKALFLACFCFQGVHLSSGVVLNHFANLLVFAAWGLCMIPNLVCIGRPGGQPISRRMPASHVRASA